MVMLKTWADGNAWAAALTTGGAAAGEWRMPAISELQDLWADPAVGSNNLGLDANFIEVQGTSLYWTSTSSSATVALALLALGTAAVARRRRRASVQLRQLVLRRQLDGTLGVLG